LDLLRHELKNLNLTQSDPPPLKIPLSQGESLVGLGCFGI